MARELRNDAEEVDEADEETPLKPLVPARLDD